MGFPKVLALRWKKIILQKLSNINRSNRQLAKNDALSKSAVHHFILKNNQKNRQRIIIAYNENILVWVRWWHIPRILKNMVIWRLKKNPYKWSSRREILPVRFAEGRTNFVLTSTRLWWCNYLWRINFK